MLPPKASRSMMAAQRRGSVKVLVQPERVSLVAIATELSLPARSTLFPAGRLPVRTGSAERGLPASPVARAAWVPLPDGWMHVVPQDRRAAASTGPGGRRRLRISWMRISTQDRSSRTRRCRPRSWPLGATQSPPVARLFCEPVGVDPCRPAPGGHAHCLLACARRMDRRGGAGSQNGVLCADGRRPSSGCTECQRRQSR